MHITQGDYDGKAVIISWVTADEPGPSKVQYGTSEKKYDFSADGTVTNYTFYNYKSGYIHHCLLDGLEVNIFFSFFFLDKWKILFIQASLGLEVKYQTTYDVI